MSEKNTGGPAFPVIGMSQRFGQPIEQVFASGLTMRDYFAAKVLQGLIIRESNDDQVWDCYSPIDEDGVMQSFAVRAYMFADAMLKAREA